MLPWGRMLLPGIAGFQPAPVRSDALIAWRTSGTVQTPSWDRRLPACSGSKRCAYRMEDLWNSPNSFLGSQASSLLRFEAMRLSHGGPLEQSKLLPGIAGFQPAPVRSDALIAWRTSGTVQTPSW